MHKTIVAIMTICLLNFSCSSSPPSELVEHGHWTEINGENCRPAIKSPMPIIWNDQRGRTTLWPLKQPVKIRDIPNGTATIWISDKTLVALGVPEGKAAILEYRTDRSLWLIGHQEAPF